MNNSGTVITRADSGLSQFVFAADIKVVRPNGSESVIVRFGKRNIPATQTAAAIQTALGNSLLPVTEAGVTVYIGRANLDRVVDDGADQAVFVFNDETSIETTTTFSTLDTITQSTVPLSGAGTPESAVTAPPGMLYVDTDGGAATTLYVKESGTGNTGWVAK